MNLVGTTLLTRGDVSLNHGTNAGCETETSYLEAAYWKTLPLVNGSAGLRPQVLLTRFTGPSRPKTTILIVCLQYERFQVSQQRPLSGFDWHAGQLGACAERKSAGALSAAKDRRRSVKLMRLTPAYFSARDAGIFQKHGLDALPIDERKCFRRTPIQD